MIFLDYWTDIWVHRVISGSIRSIGEGVLIGGTVCWILVLGWRNARGFKVWCSCSLSKGSF